MVEDPERSAGGMPDDLAPDASSVDGSSPDAGSGAGLGASQEQLDALASSLLWRIGRAFDDGPVTVRLGLASAAPLFADLSRLRPASDQEVEAALQSGDVSVEWVGPRGKP